MGVLFPITAVDTRYSTNSFRNVPNPRLLKLRRQISLPEAAINLAHYVQNLQLPIGCLLVLRTEHVLVLVAVLFVLVGVEGSLTVAVAVWRDHLGLAGVGW